MRLKTALTIASLKMFVRQKEAILWTLILPLFIVLLFGFVSFDGLGILHVGLVNESSEPADALEVALRNVKALEVSVGEREEEMAELGRGDRDLVVVLEDNPTDLPLRRVRAFGDPEAKPREVQLAVMAVQRVFDDRLMEVHEIADRTVLQVVAVQTRNLRYIDFLIPGVISMSIMQMGIFGVAFGFVSLKKRGILRTLSVTPLKASDFIFAQVFTRVSVLMLQMGLMVGVGILFLDLHFVGDLFLMVLLGLLGAIVFLAIGFALAGVSRSEDQVAPLANLISVPMLLLSGVFFNRSNLPAALEAVTEFFPLTFLADGMREVAIEGATIVGILPQILGLGAWCAIAVVAAVKLFRWE
ncbi:MAG: ABC transporter permease [Bacteroidota bacterium]